MKEKDVITFYTITLLDLSLLALLVGLGYLPFSLSVILWLPPRTSSPSLLFSQ